jgi:beta-glucanase (GH16 family)
MITPHPWNYPPGEAEAAKAMLDKQWPYPHPCDMSKLGIPSTWYETFHTYGCKITATETTYYCDNIEIGHHATLMNCKKYPLYFLVNLATGGGWPVDLSRYNGLADMYVDFIRVYQGNQ